MTGTTPPRVVRLALLLLRATVEGTALEAETTMKFRSECVRCRGVATDKVMVALIPMCIIPVPVCDDCGDDVTGALVAASERREQRLEGA